MTDFRNSFDNKTLTIEGRAVSIRTDKGLNIASRVKETDLTAIAASVLELYGTPEKVSDSYYASASTTEEYADLPTSDEGLLWQAYARLKALEIRAERKAVKDAELQKEVDAATLLEESKQTVAMAYTGKYFSELGRTKRALVTALASQQLALKEALKKETK